MDTFVSEIRLKNFLSFKNLTYKPTLGINIIFGENGAGKTNLLKVFKFINEIFNKSENNYFSKLFSNIDNINDIKNYRILTKAINFIKKPEIEKEMIYKRYSMLNIEEPIEVLLKGKYKGKKYEYFISLKEDDRINKEYLKISISGKGQPKLIFLKEDENLKLSLFLESKYNMIIKKSINKNNNISFISSFRFINEVLDEYNFMYKDITKEEKDEYVLDFLSNFLDNYLKITPENNTFNIGFDKNINIQIMYPYTNSKDEKEFIDKKITEYKVVVNKFSEFIQELDEFSRGASIETKTDSIEKRLIIELTHHKIIGGKELSIPFLLESDGTKKIIELFNIINNINNSLILYDEINAYLHDNLLEKYIKFLKNNNINKQYFLTTHNTSILDYNFLDNKEKQIIQRSPLENRTYIKDLTGINLRENKSYYFKIGKYGGSPSRSDIFYER